GVRSGEQMRRVAENRRERVVEIQRDGPRELQRTIQFLFLREIDFDRLRFAISRARAPSRRAVWREQLKEKRFRSAFTENTNAGIERRDGDSFAPQLECCCER